MKKRFLLILTAAIVAAALAPGLAAQSQAVVTETTGKVEIQPPGGAWQAARVGMNLARGATVSTGFNSSAVIDLGASILQVKPLTRMQLQELIEQGGAVSTDLFLKVGKVRAEVKTTAGLTQDFKLRSPVSTAAVRGTIFEFEDLIVEVIDGQVYFTNLYNQTRSVGGGEGSSTDGYSVPASLRETQDDDFSVDTSTSKGDGGSGTQQLKTATVTVTWVWE